MFIDMRWWVNSSSCWAQQRLHLRLVGALGSLSIERRRATSCSHGCLSPEKKKLIYKCINIYTCTLFNIAAAQRCSSAWESIAWRHLELGLKNQKIVILKQELKRFVSLRNITLAGSKSRFVQRFCLLSFGMQGELHALFAWMNGKCWNNCLTLFSGVTGSRILSCESHWCMTDNASLFLPSQQRSSYLV